MSRPLGSVRRSISSPTGDGKDCHVAHIGGYGAETVGCKPQAVIDRRVGAHARKVGDIGFKQVADIVFDKLGKRQDDCIALGVTDIGDGAGRLSHRLEQRVDFGHVGYAKQNEPVTRVIQDSKLYR